MNKQENIIEQDIKTLCNGLCMCGCGTVIALRDRCGRPKRYVKGHNTRKAKELKIEIDKIKTFEEAKAIIFTQASIIHELQGSSGFEDSLTG
jgi:hypothetical protein